MREFLIAIGIAAVLGTGVFLLPSSYDRQIAPGPSASPSSSQTAAPSTTPAQKSATPSTAQAPAAPPPAAPARAPQQTPAAQPSQSHAATTQHQTAQSGNQPTTSTPAASSGTQQPGATSGQAQQALNVPGNPQAGRQVYRKCQACHSLEPGKNSVGPSLAGIVGKPIAADPTYNYSPAMRAAKLTWDIPTLSAYLVDPQKLIPGNKMPFPGLKTDNERIDLLAFLAANSGGAAATAQTQQPPVTAQQQQQAQPQQQAQAPAPQGAPAASQAAPATPSASAGYYVPEARYTLRSGIAEGRMVYIGVGGAIDGQINPVLAAVEGQMVQIILQNGEGAEHDIVFPDQDARSQRITGRGSSTSMSFRAGKSGDFIYFCDVPGHRLAGMEGKFVVTPLPPSQTVVEANISQLANEVPPPIGKRAPQTVRVDLLTVELEGRLAEGTTFGYWTFNGKVPGPFIRVRVGDTVEVHLKNPADSTLIHSVDFHAATGPGGGAAATQTDPGDEKMVKFKALAPGLYVYHCATPMVAHHIANGMYGLILVEPEEGLPPVDREFYVMQGEIYTEGLFGSRGSQGFSVEKLLNERPEYFVFNGSVGALSKLHPLQAKVGETIRIYFGVGGPNFTSSFHVIGEIFDKVYNLGDVLSPPLQSVQTVLVPAGGAAIVEFKLDVPGNYVLVDHALSRAERGLVGILQAEGAPNPEIFEGKVEAGGGH